MDGADVALAAGAALTGTIVPFVAEPYEEAAAGRELFNDVAAAIVCVILVTAFCLRHRAVRGGDRADR